MEMKYDVSYTKEDSGFIHPSFIAIWVWLGDQGNKRIKTRLGSSNVSTSNIVLQEERQQPKKVICPFSLCSSNCPILCYIISLGRLQAHVWGNIKTHFSLLLRPRILFQTKIFTLFWFPEEPFVFKI